MLYQKSELFSRKNIIKEAEINSFLLILVSVLCEKPSEMLGISHIKGSIEVGKQADFIVFDPEDVRTVGDDEIRNKYKENCIYRNREMRGRVRETYLRGI
jgi:allantoinase